MTRKHFLSLGECMIELSQADAECWRMGIAGDTLNTAWYARAFLDPSVWRVDYFTRLGRDPYSDRLAGFLDAADIGAQWIARDETRQPGLYMIETTDGERSFTYWRSQSAARLLADDTGLLAQALSASDIAYFSGITLAILAPDRRKALLDALSVRRAAGGTIVFDPNIRPKLWEDADTMRDAIMASTRSRSRHGLAAISDANPKRCMAVDTACTCPWARERSISKAFASGTKVSPCNDRRMISISASGRCDRLPSVSFLTAPPSR